MTRFYPVYVRRSDGKLEIAGKGGIIKEKNAPSKSQLDRTPNSKGVADYYREIDADEVKHLDWRRKLAGMLVKEIGGQQYADRQANCILVTLPENYRLFEHIKSRVTDQDGNSQPAKKNHAGGGHDRQDAYLYGHPQGPKKRFRSPADFFPHLLWLCTDTTGDRDNCSCKLCCPEEIEEKKPAAQNTSTTNVKKEETETKPSLPIRHPIVEIPARTNAVANPKLATPIPPAVKSNTQVLIPSRLPQPRSTDQQVDARFGGFQYRQGEIIWFNRGPTQWGLGVVIRRYFGESSNQQPAKKYIVCQPLGPPFLHEQAVIRENDSELRPWLAWSPPNFMNYRLNGSQPPPTWDTMNWEAFRSGAYGSSRGTELQIDGSILAAKYVDGSFTLLECLRRITPAPGIEDRSWNGIFLGGEKIWVGDAVRIKIGTGSDVMVLTEIIERTENAGKSNATTIYIFVGDVYSFTSLEPQMQDIPNLPGLPYRMQQDLAWRNSITSRAGKPRHYWKLDKVAQRYNMHDIRGRYYDLSYLYPLLASSKYDVPTMLSKGELEDTNVWINARNDRALHHGRRIDDRKTAFKDKIPKNVEFVPGTNAPTPQQHTLLVQQSYQQSQPPLEQQMAYEQSAPEPVAFSAGHDESMAEFIDMTAMDQDDSLPGFGQEYSNQDAQRQYF